MGAASRVVRVPRTRSACRPSLASLLLLQSTYHPVLTESSSGMFSVLAIKIPSNVSGILFGMLCGLAIKMPSLDREPSFAWHAACREIPRGPAWHGTRLDNTEESCLLGRCELLWRWANSYPIVTRGTPAEHSTGPYEALPIPRRPNPAASLGAKWGAEYIYGDTL